MGSYAPLPRQHVRVRTCSVGQMSRCGLCAKEQTLPRRIGINTDLYRKALRNIQALIDSREPRRQ